MSQPLFCYFDNNATTRVAPEVLEVLLPCLEETWGNPSSAYRFGREAAKQMEQARGKVAALIRAEPSEVVFTSCGTESINAAIQSALMADPDKRHLVMTAVEHPANLGYAAHLRRQGYEVSFLSVDGDGRMDLSELERTIRPDTAMVSAMWANNETGLVFPVREIGAICRRNGVFFHTDAVQAAGKVRIDLEEVPVDFLSLSAHKLHAPKGIGVLYVNRRVRFQPYLIGGHQEQGRRGGTENVAYMVAFGRAAELALTSLSDQDGRVRALRDRLETGILRGIPGTCLNGAMEPRLPNTSNISFAGVEAEAVLLALDQAGICVSSGSACTAGSPQPSHVLKAMGLSLERAKGSLRFSLGIYNTEKEVDYVLDQLPGIIRRLREISPSALASGFGNGPRGDVRQARA